MAQTRQQWIRRGGGATGEVQVQLCLRRDCFSTRGVVASATAAVKGGLNYSSMSTEHFSLLHTVHSNLGQIMITLLRCSLNAFGGFNRVHDRLRTVPSITLLADCGTFRQ